MEITWLYCTIPIAVGLGFLLVLLYACCALSGRISQQQEEMTGYVIKHDKPSETPKAPVRTNLEVQQIKKWNARYPDWSVSDGKPNH
jgi:hypothetical protein